MAPEKSLDEPQVLGMYRSPFDKQECQTQRGAEGNDKRFSARYSLQALKLSVTDSFVIR